MLETIKELKATKMAASKAGANRAPANRASATKMAGASKAGANRAGASNVLQAISVLRTIKAVVGAVVCVTVAAVSGETITWKTPGAGGSFSAPGNWDLERAPQAGDDVVVSSTAAVTLTADVAAVYRSFTWTSSANATLAGQLATSDGASLALTVKATTNTVTAALSGAGAFAKTGAGALRIGASSSAPADNRTFSGNVTVSAGNLLLFGLYALGNNNTFTVDGTPLSVFTWTVPTAGKVTQSWNLKAGGGSGNRGSWTMTNNDASKMAEFDGGVSYTGARTQYCPSFMFSGTKGWRINGDVTSTSRYEWDWRSVNSGVPLYIYGTVRVEYMVNGQGGLRLNGPMLNSSVRVGNGIVTLYSDNVFTDGTSDFRYSGGYNAQWGGGCLDMNGHSACIRDLYLANATTHANASYKMNIIKSSTPATLTVLGATKWGVAGAATNIVLQGAASLLYGGDATCEIVTHPWASDNTTIGGLTVTNGVMNIRPTVRFPSLSTLTVKEKGRMCVETSDINPANVQLTVADDGVLELAAGVQLNVLAATHNGRRVPRGTYSGGAFDWLAGDGMLMVQIGEAESGDAEEFVWTGAGNDASLRTAANWRDGTAPTLRGGTETLDFSGGTDNATVSGAAEVFSLTFSRGAPFTLTAADAGATLTAAVGVAGANTGAGDGVVTNVIDVPLCVRQFTTDARTAFRLARGFTLPADDSLNLLGDGQVLFDGDNSGLAGTVTVTASSKCPVFDGRTAPVGAPGAVIRLNRATESVEQLFEGDPVTVDADVAFEGSASGILTTRQSAVFNGNVTAKAGRLNFYGASKVWLNGGVASGISAIWNKHGNGPAFECFVTNKPLTAESFTLDFYPGSTFHLGGEGHTWTLLEMGNTRLKCWSTNTLARAGVIFNGYYRANGGIDLNGYDQTVAGLRDNFTVSYRVNGGGVQGGLYAASSCYVTSEAPAVLTIEGAGYKIPSGTAWKWLGAASLRYRADTDFVVSNVLSRTSGFLEVTKSRVILAGNAGWLGPAGAADTGTVVRVSGAGVVRAENRTSLANGTSMFQSAASAPSTVALEIGGPGGSDGALELPAGFTETVARLFVSGHVKREGLYCGTDAPVTGAIPVPWIRGGGQLRVLRADCGTLLLFR